MKPAIAVALLWLVFGGLHVGLATRGARSRLTAALGEIGFQLVFSALAAVSFAALVHFFAVHRNEGAAGLALGAVGALRWPLVTVAVLGVALATSGIGSYLGSPIALFSERVRPPRGIDRITRHSFFFGVALVALAHVLLATHLVGAVFAAGFAALTLGGGCHQDRKLARLRGKPYADYLAGTSFVPFAAILAGRQRLVVEELPFSTIAVGIGLGIGLHAVNESVFAHGGVWFIAAVLLGAAWLSLETWRANQAGRRPDRDEARARETA